MQTSSPPAPPDPKETAAAQTAMNKETAITQYGLGATNQVTPQGTLSYKQIGSWPDGTPRYEATTAYSPEQQALYGQQQEFDKKFNDLALGQTDRLSGVLNQPLNLDNQAVESRLFELGRQRLDPMFAQQNEALRTRMANQGIELGSEAYKNAFGIQGQKENDAMTQLLLSGRGQSIQELLTQRNQPINEITALMSGGQVTQPNFTGTPQPQVAGTNYAGLVSDNYQQQLSAWNAQQQQQAAGMGGLFGLGGNLLGGWARGGFAMPSDRRLKKNIRQVGNLENGLPVYEYSFNWENKTRHGLMADDVERFRPEAVAEINGYKHVNYGLAMR